MAWSPTEYMEVAVPAPAFPATVDDRWVVAPDYVYSGPSTPGNVPRFTVAVMDATTETAELYSGVGWFAAAAATSGYAWIVSQATSGSSARSLIKFDPSTGGNTNYTAPTLAPRSAVLAVGSHIWVINTSGTGTTNMERFNVSTSLWDTAFTGSLSVHGYAWDGGSYVYIFHPSSVIRYDVTTGTATTVTPSGYQTPAQVRVARDPYGVFWYYVFNTIYRWDPGVSYTAIAGGVVGSSTTGVYGDDGFMYFVVADKLVACDLAGSSVASYALLPSRADRYAVECADGRLWIPAGAPYTR